MSKHLRQLIIRIFVIIAVFSIMVAIIYITLHEFMPEMIPLLESGDQQAIAEYIRSGGTIKGMLFTSMLQFLLVISIAFPSAPIQISAGVVFGALKGFRFKRLSYMLHYESACQYRCFHNSPANRP